MFSLPQNASSNHVANGARLALRGVVTRGQCVKISLAKILVQVSAAADALIGSQDCRR